MSADFWAGYISGAVGILIGNPLDILKVRLQTSAHHGATMRTSGAWGLGQGGLGLQALAKGWEAPL